MPTRTIRCKLLVSEEIASDFLETSRLFAESCNRILAKALESKESNPLRLHRLVYRQIREAFPLSANLVIRAIRRVSDSLSQKQKKQRPKPKLFRPGSIQYDARIFSFWEEKGLVSLTTLQGRRKALLDIGDYQKEALKGKKPTSATLVRCRSNWYLNIVIEEADPPFVEGPPIGIDLGLRNMAYTSTHFAILGGPRQEFKKKASRIRASLQSRGTRGSKRKLHSLAGYERRRIRHENHVFSKQLVEEAQRHNAGIIRMEQLSGIRDRTKVWNPHRNRTMAGWSFYQLQQFISYKAKKVGIQVEFVNPAYSSQTCHQCNQKGDRSGEVFKCRTCGKTDADYNAACVLSTGGAVVNRPKLTICTHIS